MKSRATVNILGDLTFCSSNEFQNFVHVSTKRKKGWRLRTREKWLPSLRPKAQRFVFVFVIVLISVFVSVFIAEVKSPKAFNCDDDEAAGAKLKAKPTTSYCYQSF